MHDVSPATVLVLAISARPYVTALNRAGYRVIAIDSFADHETIALSHKSLIVTSNDDGFDAKELFAEINRLNLSQILGVIYGSGFESQPNLLEQIHQMVPVIGNAAHVLKAIKDPRSFFEVLKKLGVTCPALYENSRDLHTTWLVKKVGGSGGQHIQYVQPQKVLTQLNTEDEYWQTYIEGQPVSILFLAYLDDKVNFKVVKIGVNRQMLAPTKSQPFRYGGAVSDADVTDQVARQLIDAATKVTTAFGLLGLNSLDAIVRDDQIYVLEVNPRLSATFDLYAEHYWLYHAIDLMDLHIHVCLNRITSNIKKQLEKMYLIEKNSRQSKAQLVLYAESDYKIHRSFPWPSWVVDRPSFDDNKKYTDEMNINIERPVCMVQGSGINASMALEEAHLKLNQLKVQLKQTCEITK